MQREKGAAMHGMQLQLAVFLGCMSTLAHAALDCGAESNAVTFTTDIGPRHHPIGRPLPQNAEFNQPIDCGNGVWFFDLNNNGRSDPGEPKLFGPLRVTGCSSCHAESPDTKTAASVSVFLRQDAGVLCLICHRL
jgi:predicted CXXCH cytochrome family protein